MRLVPIASVIVLGGLAAGCGEDTTSGPGNTTSTTVCSTTPDTTQVPVVVIVQDVAEGTTAEDAIESGALVEETIDWGFRPLRAFESFESLAGGVAIADLPANQAAVPQQWGLPTDVTLQPSPHPPLCDG